MINTILSASGAAVKFADIDGTALQFVTETRPAKWAFAWHAEEALHFGKAVGWPAASLLTVPPSAWSSDTCDSSIRDQYFHDLLELQAALVSDQDEGLHDWSVPLDRCPLVLVVPCQPLETFYTQAGLLQLWKRQCCHSAILPLVYIYQWKQQSIKICELQQTESCSMPRCGYFALSNTHTKAWNKGRSWSSEDQDTPADCSNVYVSAS